MSKKKEDRRVYVFEEVFHDTYVKYTKENKDDHVRARCTLYRYLEGKTAEIGERSFTVDKDADICKEIAERAQELFAPTIKKIIDNKEKDESKYQAVKPLYMSYYANNHPFRRFVLLHFESIALLRDWENSTAQSYRNTLLNQIAPSLPEKNLAKLTAMDFDKTIAHLKKAYEETTGSTYSVGRVGCFFFLCYIIMEYAAELYGFTNVMKDSKFYDERELRNTLEPIEKKVERRLRAKSLTIKENCKSAQLLLEAAKSPDSRIGVLGNAALEFAGTRVCEAAGARCESRIPFLTKGYEDRHCLVVQAKVDTTGKFNPDLKTINGYRILPMIRVFDMLFDSEMKKNKEEYGLSDEELPMCPFATKNGRKPLKPNELGKLCKAVIKKSLSKKRYNQLALPIPEAATKDGQSIPIEENDTAYQYRRNYCHYLLNVVGMPMKSAQAMLGHDIPNFRGHRWELYTEAELIKIMKQLDEVIMFPIPSEEARTKPYEQTDPRNIVHELEDAGEFLDASTLRVLCKPYSPTDKVTVHMLIDCNEPSDALHFSANSGSEMKISDVSFYSKKDTSETINIKNYYLDAVFSSLDEDEGAAESDTEETILGDEDEELATELDEQRYDDVKSELADDESGQAFSDDDDDDEDDDDEAD